MNSKKVIGVVTKPQALKGEFRLNPTLNNLKKYKSIKNVEIESKQYLVEHCTLRETFVILKLQSIDNCESAELLRGKEILASVEETVECAKDLIGFDVVVDGKSIGAITDLNNYGATDVIDIDGVVMVPLIPNIIASTDTEKQQIILDKVLFEQVVVYEN